MGWGVSISGLVSLVKEDIGIGREGKDKKGAYRRSAMACAAGERPSRAGKGEGEGEGRARRHVIVQRSLELRKGRAGMPCPWSTYVLRGGTRGGRRVQDGRRDEARGCGGISGGRCGNKQPRRFVRVDLVCGGAMVRRSGDGEGQQGPFYEGPT
jgi:hypothetical protein